MTRPVTVTSPTHPVALAAYVGQALLALQLLRGIATTRALDDAIGYGAEWAVPALMLTTSIGALCAAWAVTQAGVQRPALLLETVCTLSLGALTVAYAWSLTATYGWEGGATTQTLSWSLGVGLVARAVQTWRDHRRVKAAVEAGRPADPPPLGEPDNTRG